MADTNRTVDDGLRPRLDSLLAADKARNLASRRHTASAFKKSVESNTENQQKVGIKRDELVVVEIVAQADPPTKRE